MKIPEGILKAILSDITNDIFEEEEDRMKLEVGTLDDDLMKRYEYMTKEKHFLHEEITLKMKEVELRYKRELDAMLEPYNDRKEKIHHHFWDAVIEKNNLDPNDELNVDPETKKVYQYVKNPF